MKEVFEFEQGVSHAAPVDEYSPASNPSIYTLLTAWRRGNHACNDVGRVCFTCVYCSWRCYRRGSIDLSRTRPVSSKRSGTICTRRTSCSASTHTQKRKPNGSATRKAT